MAKSNISTDEVKAIVARQRAAQRARAMAAVAKGKASK